MSNVVSHAPLSGTSERDVAAIDEMRDLYQQMGKEVGKVIIGP